MNGARPHELRAAVEDLLAKTKYAKDDEDEARFATCWAHGAQLAITSNERALDPVLGREAILAFYRRVWANSGHGTGSTREVHVAEPPDIMPLGNDRLRARHGVSFYFSNRGTPCLRGFGTFEDEIIIEDGAFRIAIRRATLIRSP